MVTLPILVEDNIEAPDYESMGLPEPKESEIDLVNSSTKNFCFITIDYFYESDKGITIIVSRGEHLYCPLPTKVVIKEMKKVGFIAAPVKKTKKSK